MNIPNILTVLRIAMIPAFVMTYRMPAYHWSMAIFLAASATDYLDGHLARKWNQVTPFGKLMDPLADKLMLLTALYCLTDSEHLPAWIFYTMLIKESVMIAGSVFMLEKKVVVMANWYGKAATVAFILAVFSVFPWHSITWLAQAGTVMLYIALAMSILALVKYTVQAINVKNKVKIDN